MMPGMTGAQLAAELRERHPDVPVLMITGYARLPPEATRGFAVTPGRNSLRIVFSNGRAAEIANVDVCGTPRVTVTEQGIAATP